MDSPYLWCLSANARDLDKCRSGIGFSGNTQIKEQEEYRVCHLIQHKGWSIADRVLRFGRFRYWLTSFRKGFLEDTPWCRGLVLVFNLDLDGSTTRHSKRLSWVAKVDGNHYIVCWLAMSQLKAGPAA